MLRYRRNVIPSKVSTGIHMAPKKSSRSTAADDNLSMEEFDKILQEETKNDIVVEPETSKPSFYVMALFTAALPVFLYVKLKNKFGMNLADNLIYFAVISVLVAIVLAKEYIEVCKQEKLRVDKKTRSSPSDVEASAWAVFSTNLKFLGGALLLGFVFLPPGVPSIVNYLVSVGVPAGLMFGLTWRTANAAQQQ